MPFIRGRYHINAIAGEALEAAREAEAALLALEHDSEQAAEDDAGGDDDGGAAGTGKGPIHRVEIEAAELVPAHSGRAQRGFVAHVHREAAQPWAEPLVGRATALRRQVRGTVAEWPHNGEQQTILGHPGRRGPGNCRVAVIPRARRRMCLRITAI